MIHRFDDYLLRPPEPGDIEALYHQKNNSEIAHSLGGFSTGMSRADLSEWIDYHRKKDNEIIWVVADAEKDRCVGHVGLYDIDHRVGSAEFAIMIGERSAQGKGLGRACTVKAVDYGFMELNLNRIQLTVLASNERATGLYRSLGFQEEGCLREAQYKAGGHIDVLVMSLLRKDYSPNED